MATESKLCIFHSRITIGWRSGVDRGSFDTRSTLVRHSTDTLPKIYNSSMNIKYFVANNNE